MGNEEPSLEFKARLLTVERQRNDALGIEVLLNGKCAAQEAQILEISRDLAVALEKIAELEEAKDNETETGET